MADRPRPRREAPRVRTAARLAAVQALYQSDHAGISAEAALDEFVRHRMNDPTGKPFAAEAVEAGQAPGAHVPLLSRIVRGYAANAEALDAVIAEALVKGWPAERLDPVLRSILRAATAELFDASGAPARSVINEYLDIAHGFFSGEEPSFANGVLDRVARTLRSAEFEGTRAAV